MALRGYGTLKGLRRFAATGDSFPPDVYTVNYKFGMVCVRLWWLIDFGISQKMRWHFNIRNKERALWYVYTKTTYEETNPVKKKRTQRVKVEIYGVAYSTTKRLSRIKGFRSLVLTTRSRLGRRVWSSTTITGKARSEGVWIIFFPFVAVGRNLWSVSIAETHEPSHRSHQRGRDCWIQHKRKYWTRVKYRHAPFNGDNVTGNCRVTTSRWATGEKVAKMSQNDVNI